MAVGWKVKPQLGRNRRRQAPRLGSLETWRSDLIVESSSQVSRTARSHELSPPGALSKSRCNSPKPKVLLTVAASDLGKELSVIGFKPAGARTFREGEYDTLVLLEIVEEALEICALELIAELDRLPALLWLMS